jgi:hypothetical protein
MEGTHATYSPEDNKLRFYPAGRLDSEDYATAKACGFRWAPRQELFVCPAWNPQAEDLLEMWCGEIGDEDTTLGERAAQRAERFEGYSDNRARDAEQAHDAVQAITEGIPLGQPILIGHHSEKRARKDQEKIERGMDRALKAWKTSEYWEWRAKGAIADAKYKERPEVRARRIKRLEAERRKRVASYTPHGPEFMQEQSAYLGRHEDGTGKYCWEEHGHETKCDNCKAVPHVMVNNKGIGSHPAPVASLPARERAQARHVEHLDRRLAYERTMLGEQGALDLLKPKPRPKQPPILNYQAETITVWQRYNREQPEILTQQAMTRAEYAKVYKDNKWCVLSEDKTHRIRFASLGGFRGPRVCVFLSDSKAHPVPAPVEPDQAEEVTA